MFGTIIKDFFTVIFVLFLGFIGCFNLYIQHEDDDIQFRIEDIKKYVGSLQNEKLNKYEGKINVIIFDREEKDFVYIAFPYSYLNPGFFFWEENHTKFNIGIGDVDFDRGEFVINDRDVKLSEIRRLVSGQMIVNVRDEEDEDQVIIWRSMKTLPKNLMD